MPGREGPRAGQELEEARRPARAVYRVRVVPRFAVGHVYRPLHGPRTKRAEGVADDLGYVGGRRRVVAEGGDPGRLGGRRSLGLDLGLVSRVLAVVLLRPGLGLGQLSLLGSLRT